MKFVPDRIFGSVAEITSEVAAAEGVKGLVLDVDNTLAPKHVARPDAQTVRWADEIRKEGIRLFLVSNNKYSRVAEFAKVLDLPFIHYGMKPLPHSFRRAVRLMQLEPAETAAVGDQIFTDIMGAHSAGLKAWLVMPIDIHETFSFRIRRRMERPVIERYYSRQKGSGR